MTLDVGGSPFYKPYRWRPLTWKYKDETGKSLEYCNERAIATQQTVFSFVSQLRNWLPKDIGSIIWFGFDDAATSVFVPS
jgi:dipeptidase